MFLYKYKFTINLMTGIVYVCVISVAMNHTTWKFKVLLDDTIAVQITRCLSYKLRIQSIHFYPRWAKTVIVSLGSLVHSFKMDGYVFKNLTSIESEYLFFHSEFITSFHSTALISFILKSQADIQSSWPKKKNKAWILVSPKKNPFFSYKNK